MKNKEKQSVYKKNISTRPCIKPSLFQFPSLMQKTNGFQKPQDKQQFSYQIPQSITPDPQYRVTLFKPKSVITRNPLKIQRNSAKIVRIAQPNQEPVIVKFNVTKSKQNVSQYVQQSEEQSVYQLSEIETFDDLILQIQENIDNNTNNIVELAEQINSLEAMDQRGIKRIPELIRILIEQSIFQNIFNRYVLATILTMTEEILMRDDLEGELITQISKYIASSNYSEFPMLIQFIKRSGQTIIYIRPDKQLVLAGLLAIILIKLWTKNPFLQESELNTLRNGINLLLRCKTIRKGLPNLQFPLEPNSSIQHIIYEQINAFKLSFN